MDTNAKVVSRKEIKLNENPNTREIQRSNYLSIDLKKKPRAKSHAAPSENIQGTSSESVTLKFLKT